MRHGEQLLDVIDHLTIVHTVYEPVEGQKDAIVRHDGLIKQLREAIASSLVGGNVAGGSSSGVPLDADALERYDQIERLITAWYFGAGLGVPGLLPEDNLRALYAHVWANEPDEICTRIVESWRTQIREKLDPPTTFELIDTGTHDPVPCPECGFGWFEVVTNKGTHKGKRWFEKERRVALTVRHRPDGRGGLDKTTIDCGCCGWSARGTTQIRALAFELEAVIAGQKGSSDE